MLPEYQTTIIHCKKFPFRNFNFHLFLYWLLPFGNVSCFFWNPQSTWNSKNWGKTPKWTRKCLIDYFNKIHQKEVEINTAIKIINQLEGQFNQDQVLIDYYWELVQFYHQQRLETITDFHKYLDQFDN